MVAAVFYTTYTLPVPCYSTMPSKLRGVGPATWYLSHYYSRLSTSIYQKRRAWPASVLDRYMNIVFCPLTESNSTVVENVASDALVLPNIALFFDVPRLCQIVSARCDGSWWSILVSELYSGARCVLKRGPDSSALDSYALGIRPSRDGRRSLELYQWTKSISYYKCTVN